MQEAATNLKAYDKTSRMTVAQMPPQGLGAQPVAYALSLAQNGTSSSEIIEEKLTLPPNPQRVWRIVRTVRFPAGQQPLVKNVIDDLRHKYGQESFANAGAIPNLHWYFDEQGQRAVGGSGASSDRGLLEQRIRFSTPAATKQRESGSEDETLVLFRAP